MSSEGDWGLPPVKRLSSWPNEISSPAANFCSAPSVSRFFPSSVRDSSSSTWTAHQVPQRASGDFVPNLKSMPSHMRTGAHDKVYEGAKWNTGIPHIANARIPTLDSTLLGKFVLLPTKKVRTTCVLTCKNNGASNQTRTDDPRFTRAVLYQLSYAGLRLSAQLLYGDAFRFASVTADFSMDSLTGWTHTSPLAFRTRHITPIRIAEEHLPAQKSRLPAHFRQITEYENSNFLRGRR